MKILPCEHLEIGNVPRQRLKKTLQETSTDNSLRSKNSHTYMYIYTPTFEVEPCRFLVNVKLMTIGFFFVGFSFSYFKHGIS